MEAGNKREDKSPRSEIDVERFLDVYRWVDAQGLDKLAIAFEAYMDEGFAVDYPRAVVDLYSRLTESDQTRFRHLAAIGIHNVTRLDPEAGSKLVAQLLEDAEPTIAEQTRETLREADAGSIEPSVER